MMSDLDQFTTLMDRFGAKATAAAPFSQYSSQDAIYIEVENTDEGTCTNYTPLFAFNRDGSFKGVGVII